MALITGLIFYWFFVQACYSMRAMLPLNFFAVAGLAIGASCLMMAIVMFVKGRGRLHYLWGLFCLSVMIWGIGGFLIGTTTDAALADTWWRITHIGVISIPILFTHFIFEYLDLRRPRFLALLYALGIFFLIVNFIDGLFITNMRWVFNQFYYDSPPGPFYIPFTIFFFGLVIYSHIELWRAYKKAYGLQKVQIKYFFFGMLFSFAGGGLSFLPVYSIDLYPYFNIASCFYIFIVGYTILKYRLMDIRVAITRSIVYAILVTVVMAAFSFVTLLGAQYVTPHSRIGQVGLVGIASFIIVLLLHPLKLWLGKLTNRIFFKAAIHYPRATKQITDVINEEIELYPLIQRLTHGLEKELRVSRVQVLLPVGEHIFFAPEEMDSPHADDMGSRATQHAPITGATRRSDVLSKPLLQYLIHTHDVITLDELDRRVMDATSMREKKRFQGMRDRLERIRGEVIVPIVDQQELVALVVLQRKLSGESFSEEDIQLLQVIAPQIASGLQKARLYQEAKEFTIKLKREVERATADLRTANEKLKALDRVKSEFMSIASHQLRTPLTGIIGYLDMMTHGDFGDLASEQKPIIHDVLDASQRLARLVNTFLNVTRIEAGRFTINYATAPFRELITSMVTQLQPAAEKKHLQLIYVPTTLPIVEVDIDKMKDVIGNLIDNAIKYTDQGSITVRAAATASTIRFSVQDTGIGIAKGEVKQLFHKFVRGEGGTTINPNGAGLGLYIAKKIVEGHHGRIWAESNGAGKGASFFVEIPILGSRSDQETPQSHQEPQNDHAPLVARPRLTRHHPLDQ